MGGARHMVKGRHARRSLGKMKKQLRNKWINYVQTPDERREKYARLKLANFTVAFARRARDWTNSHINKQIKAWENVPNRIKNPKFHDI